MHACLPKTFTNCQRGAQQAHCLLLRKTTVSPFRLKEKFCNLKSFRSLVVQVLSKTFAEIVSIYSFTYSLTLHLVNIHSLCNPTITHKHHHLQAPLLIATPIITHKHHHLQPPLLIATPIISYNYTTPHLKLPKFYNFFTKI
jgi:hypothetical protein